MKGVTAQQLKDFSNDYNRSLKQGDKPRVRKLAKYKVATPTDEVGITIKLQDREPIIFTMEEAFRVYEQLGKVFSSYTKP